MCYSIQSQTREFLSRRVLRFWGRKLMASGDLPDRRQGTRPLQYSTVLTFRSMASEGSSSNTPPNQLTAGLSSEHTQTSLAGANRPERQTPQYATPINDGSITLADIWDPNTLPDNRLSSNQHQHNLLNNQSGSEFLQIDQLSQNQTDTGDQNLRGNGEPGRQLSDWTSVERAHVSVGTGSGSSNHHRLALEEVIPRDTAVYMISLYFDYVCAPADTSPSSLTQYRSTLWYLVFTDPPFFSECTNATTRSIPVSSL